MKLEIKPFTALESKIDGLKIINVKMVTDDRGTVRELYRESEHMVIFAETLYLIFDYPYKYYTFKLFEV